MTLACLDRRQSFNKNRIGIVNRFAGIAFAVTGLILTSVLHAEDWPEFRGPTGQGNSSVVDLPLTWSDSENVAWKVELPGLGWSSPVVANDRIYLTTAVGQNLAKAKQSLRAVCLNAKDGSEIWNVEAFSLKKGGFQVHGKNSHASATPIIENDRLYIHFGPYGTACLKLEDGSTVWKHNELVYKPVHGNGGSPAIAGDQLVICCDGSDLQFVVGLNKNTGKQIWKTDRDTTPKRGFSFCTPTIIQAGGKQQAICPGSDAVFSYDPKTGKELWRVRYGNGYSVVPRPLFAHGLVYVCSGFGDGQLFAIDPTGDADVTDTHVKWSMKKGIPRSSSLVMAGAELFIVDDRGVGTCVDAKTGDVHWTERLGGKYSASPTVAGDRVYFQDEDGKTIVLQTGREFKKLAENEVGEGKARTFASFAVVDKAILLRSETHLYRIEAK